MVPMPQVEGGEFSGPGAKPRVVILGAGFGGLNAALALRRADVEVIVIDRRNYHLFQPLLYQVATAGLSPAQIAQPIRSLLSRQANATVLMDRVVDVDLEHTQVLTRRHRVHYDYLIVATGARHAYFGNDQWEAFAPGLKKIEEATGVRRRILTAFEKAEMSDDAAERRRLLTFAVIGGGPTGVEMAGAVAELARKSIVNDFRRIDSAQSRIVLIEAGPRILSTFPETLSRSAERQLDRLGVEVITGDAVVGMDAAMVQLASGRRIDTGAIVWAAGVMASPAAQWLKAKSDQAGRIPVGPTLGLTGFANIFVIGDTASVTDANGTRVPGVAPAAKQMGRHAADSIVRRLRGKPEPAFRYRDFGNLATIGRKAAVADFGRLKLSGFPAWLLWSFAHIWFLIGFRNRLGVFLDWTFSYVTYHRGARIITGSDG
ncbi:MAG: NAD(P)/FAD-dependent oxidoreductase [Pseudomonadota bacterium]|nr:NAD(P)/FAD-dependent oxidoreductase [Pseudomonadota bacterium]